MLVFGCGSAKGPSEPAIMVEANRLAALGSQYYNLGCYKQARDYFTQALKASRLLDDLPGILRSLNNLGAANLALGFLDEAGENLKQALEVNIKVKDGAEESLILGNLAGVAYKAGRVREAEDLWRRAVRAAEADEARTGLVLHLNNLGMLLRTENRRAEAWSVLKRAEKEAAEKERTGLLAGAYFQMGLLAWMDDDPGRAEEYLETALELDKKNENPRGIAQDLQKLGQLDQSRQMWARAARELDRAIYLYAALGQKDKVAEVYRLIQLNRTNSGRPDFMEPYDRLVKGEDEISDSLLCE